jgi:hypothetical protein
LRGIEAGKIKMGRSFDGVHPEAAVGDGAKLFSQRGMYN